MVLFQKKSNNLDEFPSYEPIIPKIPSSFKEEIKKEEVKEKEEEGPYFVKIEKYKEIVDILDGIKNKLKEANDVLIKLQELKESEDKEISNWKDSIDEIKEKILDIDKKLFELK